MGICFNRFKHCPQHNTQNTQQRSFQLTCILLTLRKEDFIVKSSYGWN
jgi:hypothetical protein